MNLSLACIITCHNRKSKTLACLDSLLKTLPQCNVYLTDDGSTDGTREAVASAFPNVIILQGDGNLYWNRGMYTAWKEATKTRFDYYLWINDDMRLYPFFFQELMECHNLCGKESIISGIIEDQEGKEILYGGTNDYGKLITSSSIPENVDHMNGGVVLIPQCVIDKIGILDPTYIHDLGDVDYGLTAKEYGIKVCCTRKPVAAGYKNDFCRVRKWGTNIRERFRVLYTPLGSPPKLNFYFRKKHFGIMNAATYWIFQYAINIMPDSVISMLFGDKYKDK